MREAIVALDDADLEAVGFGGLVTRLRDAGIRDVEMIEDDGTTCMPQVEVDVRLAPAELAALDCVDSCELVAQRDDSYLYLFELTALALPERTDDDHDALVGRCDTTLTERGVLLSLVGSQDVIRDMLRNYQAAGATPGLRKLAEYTGRERTLDGLTDRQLEVLTTAFEMGFYEIPRQASTDEIAGALDLDSATVSEHLQRAERNLLTQQLPT